MEDVTTVLVDFVYSLFCVEGGSYHQLLFVGEYLMEMLPKPPPPLIAHRGHYPQFLGATVITRLGCQVWSLFLAPPCASVLFSSWGLRAVGRARHRSWLPQASTRSQSASSRSTFVMLPGTLVQAKSHGRSVVQGFAHS